MLLHFSGDGSASVLGASVLLLFSLLELDFGRLVVDCSPSEHRVELKEQLVTRIWCAVDYCVVVANRDVQTFAFAELHEVFPVICFFVEAEAVVELVHLNFRRVETLQHFCEEPPITKISLRIADLVGKIQ